MTRLTAISLLTAILGALLLQGCYTVGPNYIEPHKGMPDAWSRSVLRDLNGGPNCLEQWWKGFHDPVLTALIDQARASNPNLRIALERITEAHVVPAPRSLARRHPVSDAFIEQAGKLACKRETAEPGHEAFR
ncbi:MAG TPA: hypothetical protein PK529_15770, partial [Verrucomicrobiales bacterium]|nr:hypothetical protein [Verrucomicrobiales bacterium]